MPRVKIGPAPPDPKMLEIEIARLRVAVLVEGFAWNGKTYSSLSKIAHAITGTRWHGPRFFGLRDRSPAKEARSRSQAHAGWAMLRSKYDDGGFSGGNTDRPALRRLPEDVRAGNVDVIVVYKVDRLTRSLADFAKLLELFDKHWVSFVSVTQQFNTTTSMGRLTLNVLLSFA